MARAKAQPMATVTYRIPWELKEKLQDRAEAEMTSETQIIKDILTEIFLTDQEQPKPDQPDK
jgi:predicted transcriptional regulator